MAIPCASQPLNVEFKGGIKINYPMPFNIETQYIPESLLVYAYNITDNYQLDVSISSLELDSVDIAGDSNLYTFIVVGELQIKAVKVI